MKKRNLVILGTVIGLGVAASTLFTTKKGKEMKKRLLRKVDSIQNKLRDIEMSEVKGAISLKLEEVTEAIHQFDWEAPKEDLERKYSEIREKIIMIKDHLDVAKVKIHKQEDVEDDFTLVIDQATKTDEEIK